MREWMTGRMLAWPISATCLNLLGADYTVFDIGQFAPSWSEATGINSTGSVVGNFFQTQNGVTLNHAFLFDGAFHDLGALGGNNTYATGIDDAGRVFGYYQDASYGQHRFVYDGTFHAVANPAPISSPNGTIHAIQGNGTAPFLTYADGTTSVVGSLPGSTSGYVYGINNSGTAIGYGSFPSGWPPDSFQAFAYTRSSGVYSLGTVPGGSGSIALGINNGGTIVGFVFVWPPNPRNPNDIDRHGFVAHGSTMRDLNSLIPSDTGWMLSDMNGINDHGLIVGEGSLNGSLQRAIILVPSVIPELGETSLWAAVALGFVGILRRIKSRVWRF